MRFCLLASGSQGNCLVVQADRTVVLVDAGLSAVETIRRMGRAGLDPVDVDHIIVTHEHADHVRGLGPVARRLSATVHANAATTRAWGQVGRLPGLERFVTGRRFRLGALRVHPFRLPHDAAEPVGLIFEHDGQRLALATDLGYLPHLVRQRLQGCRAVIIEANHDPGMLRQGPYPEFLKQRVAGRTGHLANPQAAELLSETTHHGLTDVVLAHLSETNNHPDLARGAVRGCLDGLGLGRVRLEVAAQDRPGPVIDLS
ncbi:MAG: MBL fold metallo-hydrolase [Proteobacteria bacterium]|nr:MBL fold metallo-hydrolase [Pseudomonadota bacterium]